MGQRVILFDDFDDSEGNDVTRRTFAIGDTTYEIDLSDTNWQTFLGRTAEFVAVARETTSVGERLATRSRPRRSGKVDKVSIPDPPAPPQPPTSPPQTPDDLNASVRQWARENGYEIGDRGRIPQDVWTHHRKWLREQGLVSANGNSHHA